MLTYFILTFASIHSSTLLSLICWIPSLNCENDDGKFVAAIQSVYSTLNIVLIGFVVSGWSDFHWNIFPCVFSFSSWSLVDYGILLDRMLLHDSFGWLWFCVEVWLTVSCINVFICFVASTNLSSSGMNLKSLVNFSLSSFRTNVLPQDSSILYHLLGKSSNVDGNRCSHMRSSL